MAEMFLESLARMSSGSQEVQSLFNSEDGRGMRAIHRAKSNDPRYMQSLAEAATFLAQVISGKRPAYQLTEALGTSDFPLLFGDILDRQILGYYRETPQIYKTFVDIATVADFRTAKALYTDGAESTLDKVKAQAPYPETKLSEGKYEYAVEKYGRRIAFSWESIINDDMDELKRIPQRFGRAARRTESKFATQLYADANGPHASFFTDANKNRVNQACGAATNNPVLSVAALQEAFKVLAAQKDTDGEPIVIDAVNLVVPPALEIVAQNILNATELWLSESGGTANQQLHVANWMRNRVTLVVDYYLPIVSTTNGNTSWYLVASPSAGRPALRLAFLRGHAEPELFIKEANARRIGGGAMNPLDGDFDTDAIEYKVRHVLGGTRMDPKMAVASNGSGS